MSYPARDDDLPPAETGRRGPDPREDILYERIVDAVIAKQLRPGERLNENQLARAHGLSRTRAHRVLERLEREHFLRFELNRGAFISRPDRAEALAVYEARACIEEGVVRLVCRRAPPRLPAHFADFLQREAAAYRTREPGMNRISGDFHVLLAEVTGNPELLAIVKTLVHRCCVIQSLYEWPQQDLCLNHEHRDIVARIEAGDAEAAVAAMRRHLDHIVDSLRLDEDAGPPVDIYAPPPGATPRA